MKKPFTQAEIIVGERMIGWLLGLSDAYVLRRIRVHLTGQKKVPILPISLLPAKLRKVRMARRLACSGT